MHVTKKQAKFKDLKPGDTFIKNGALCMRVVVEGNSNAVNLEDGYGTYIKGDVEIARVAADIEVLF